MVGWQKKNMKSTCRKLKKKKKKVNFFNFKEVKVKEDVWLKIFRKSREN